MKLLKNIFNIPLIPFGIIFALYSVYQMIRTSGLTEFMLWSSARNENDLPDGVIKIGEFIKSNRVPLDCFCIVIWLLILSFIR
jgi:hypothetical protein